MAESMDTIEQVRANAVDLAMQFGPKVLAALFILAIGHFVGHWLCRWLDRALVRIEMDTPVRSLVVRIVRVAISVLFVIMALQNLGIELLPLIAGLGVAGAGLALAMQGVLGNLLAGLTIILTKPFRIGEYVGIAGEEGAVMDVTLFHTTLSHPDRSQVIIPNRKIVGEILHNYGKIRQLHVVVGVAYDTDLNQALALIHEVLGANTKFLKEPEPVIRVSLLADSSVDIAVKPWVLVQHYGEAAGELNKSILETFRNRGVVIPFPQREVRMLGHAA